MTPQFLTQPPDQLGRILLEQLEETPLPNRVILVSAFLGLQTVLRFKDIVAHLHRSGVLVRLVLGVDMGGTSREVLQEVSRWGVDCRIVKHRHPGHTFHPKVYFLRWNDRAEVIVGSSNFTEGGLFNNYEASLRLRYILPEDAAMLTLASQELAPVLDPQGPTALRLTPQLLAQLLSLPWIPTEAEARSRRASSRGTAGLIAPAGVNPFGVQTMGAPPPLPANVLEELVVNVRERRQQRRRESGGSDPSARVPQPSGQIAPAAFYMTLPTLQGPNIPGEARIPLDAIELAVDFWGWPEEYARKESPRAGHARVYWDWKPNWKIMVGASAAQQSIRAVRMYMYENSSDFRFYSRPLVDAGADLGDVVKITRIAEATAEFECVLAKQGTAVHRDWIQYCTHSVRNSQRRFGYA